MNTLQNAIDRNSHLIDLHVEEVAEATRLGGEADVVAAYDAPGTLFYLDPPYLPQTRGDTRNYRFELSDDDHRRLADALAGVAGRVVLSGYRHPRMDELYACWHRVDAPAKQCHASKADRAEAVWCNFTPPAHGPAAAAAPDERGRR